MSEKTRLQANKDSALDFLQLVVSGQIDLAYAKYVDMQGKHHNIYFPAGFEALKQAMHESHAQFPVKQFKRKNVLADGDLVAVHSSIVLKADDPGITVVHLFRFKNGKIVEMWDVGQEIPHESPNSDGPI
jgi:predicted SnoaL-like aldol condensation-catalyzing enzyme